MTRGAVNFRFGGRTAGEMVAWRAEAGSDVTGCTALHEFTTVNVDNTAEKWRVRMESPQGRGRKWLLSREEMGT